MISLTYERCVRTRSRAASCVACVDACPEGAITVDEGSITVTRDLCTGCGVCVGSCPTETFAGPFDPAEVVSRVETVVGCGENGLACVAGLAVEDWLVIATGVARVRVEPCAMCGEGTADLLAARLSEAKAALLALGATTELICVRRESAPNGRGPVLRQILVGDGEGDEGEIRFDPAALDPVRIRSKEVPARRQRLLAAVPPGGGVLPQEAVSWTSAKHLDPDTCTVCRMCVNVCPTGALAANRRWDEITFDAAACVRCGLCHDVCGPRALTAAPEVDLASLWAGRVSLARLATRRCAECGEPFVNRDGGEVCPSCADLDREARALLGWS